MGVRTSATRTVPGNPLAGMLRANARAARNATGRPVAGPMGPEGPEGSAGGTGATGASGTTVAAQRLVSAVDGSFTWTFATPYVVPPVVTATAEHAALHVLVTLTTVTTTAATGTLWNVVGAAAAGGVSVALMAVPA